MEANNTSSNNVIDAFFCVRNDHAEPTVDEALSASLSVAMNSRCRGGELVHVVIGLVATFTVLFRSIE